MATYAATVPSTWSADDTFRYLATFSNAAQWDPGVLDGTRLDADPVRPGSRFRLVVPFLGRKLGLTYHVTSFSAGDREVTLDAASGPLSARDQISVRPSAGSSAESASTRAFVSYRADVSLRGPLRLLDPLLSRGFRGVGDRAVAGLASVLSRPTDGA